MEIVNLFGTWHQMGRQYGDQTREKMLDVLDYIDKTLDGSNAVEYVEETFFCSFMAAWDTFSSGKLVAGRNYDAAHYSEIGRDIIVTIFHPEDGLSAAIVGYAGEAASGEGARQHRAGQVCGLRHPGHRRADL